MLQLLAPQIVHIIPPVTYLMKTQGSGSAKDLEHHILAVNKFDLAFEVQEPCVLWSDALKEIVAFPLGLFKFAPSRRLSPLIHDPLHT